MVQDKLKAGALAFLMLAALAVFDFYGGASSNRLTGAVVDGDSSSTASTSSITDTMVKNVTVYPGWNIIGFNTFNGLTGTNCIPDQIYSYVQIYKSEKGGMNSEGGYDVLEIDKSGGKFRLNGKFYTSNAGWVYNYGESCFLTSILPFKDQVVLGPRWNMLSISPRFVGHQVKEEFNVNEPGCVFGGGWLFYPERSDNWDDKWTYMDANTRFSDSDIGRGFWFYCG